MGYLGAKDLGTTDVRINDLNKIVGTNPSPDGISNPTSTSGVINLKSFGFSFNTGKEVDSRANVAGQITRLNLGSTKPVGFTLTARFNRKPEDWDSDIITGDDIDNVKWLVHWSRTKNVIMLFYMVDSGEDTLSYGNTKGFYMSQLKSIYDVIWDKNLGSSNNGYGTTEYGTSHYDVTVGGTIGTYSPCAIPIVFDNVTVRETADNYGIQVEATGFCLENEGRRG